MANAQPGIFALGTRSHHHLEFDLLPEAEPAAVIAALRGLREPPVTAGGENIVLGFGADLWRRVAPADCPDALVPFEGVQGEGRGMPATQHDVWVWIHGTGPDILLDTARAVAHALSSCAVLALEQPAFVYRDSRDLTGFIDGTENPPVFAAPEVAIVPDGETGAGGSFVIATKWVHDLDAFHHLGVTEQEGVIGRTKPDSAELADDVKPPTAHIARVVIEEDGEELELFRRSTPFGTVQESGLYFLAFSADPTRFDKMLARMFGISGDGLHDRLTDFSIPVSGAYYFAPSLQALASLIG
jgi:putative iron-dependent peroxidase